MVALRGGVTRAPVLTPTAAATVADASVHVVATATGGKVASLQALEPGGGTGSVRIGSGGVKMVDFFATWCHACKVDLGAMKAYAARAQRLGLPPLVAVDLRIAEPSTAYVRHFVAAMGVDFPVGLDATGKVTDAYAVGTLPTVVLVGDGGRILWRHTGIIGLRTLLAAARTAGGA